MNYNQKIQNKTQEIEHLSDAFEELRDRLSVLALLQLDGADNRIGSGIQYIVHEVEDCISAIECKVELDYIEKE